MWLPAASYSTAQQADLLKARLVFESVGRVWGYSYMGACLLYMSVYYCIYLSRLFPLSLPLSLRLLAQYTQGSRLSLARSPARPLHRISWRLPSSNIGSSLPSAEGPFQPAVSRPTKSRFRSQRPRHAISFTLKRTQIMKNKKLIQRSKQRPTPRENTYTSAPLIQLRSQRLVANRSAPSLVERLLQRLDGQLALLRTIPVDRLAVRRM